MRAAFDAQTTSAPEIGQTAWCKKGPGEHMGKIQDAKTPCASGAIVID
jgi:hypothetical protein